MNIITAINYYSIYLEEIVYSNELIPTYTNIDPFGTIKPEQIAKLTKYIAQQ